MSYICDDCNKMYREGSPNKVVTEERPVHYESTLVGERGNERRVESNGWETKEKLELCDGCVKKEKYDTPDRPRISNVKVVRNTDHVGHKL
jgi:hypothetical protein